MLNNEETMPFPHYLVVNQYNVDRFEWLNEKYWWFMDEWNVIYGLYQFNFHYISIHSYFVEFHSIWRSLPIIFPKVETSLFASDLRELYQKLKVEWWWIWVHIDLIYMFPDSIQKFELYWVHLGIHFQYSFWGN